MIYFDKHFFQFYRELGDNNHKEWFHANKEVYKNDVQRPFHLFISDLILNLNDQGAELDLTPEKAMFRINKDMRFNKDMTPYKLHSSALISIGDKRSKEKPGLYIELSEHYFKVAAGVFTVQKSHLRKLKKNIDELMSTVIKSEAEWKVDTSGNNGSVVSKASIDIQHVLDNHLFMDVCLNFWKRTHTVNKFLEALFTNQ